MLPVDKRCSGRSCSRALWKSRRALVCSALPESLETGVPYVPLFKGPEKTLLVTFTFPDSPSISDFSGLRALPRDAWQSLVTLARASILGRLSNSECDSYVLSESSLFVYRDKILEHLIPGTYLMRWLLY